MSKDLTTLTLVEARDKLRNRDFSALELTQSYLDRARVLNDNVKAYLRLTETQAL